jgi:hypothetical protein
MDPSLSAQRWTLQGPGENEERYERLVAAEVVTQKKEKNETKSENVVEQGSAAIASDSHECGAEREEVEEKLLREGNAEPGHSFFEISSRGQGWVTSKDESAQSKCEPGAAGQCQDLGRLADHASSAVGSTEDESLRLALIKLNRAGRYRQDCRQRWSKKTCKGSSHEGESFGCKLLGVSVTVAGVSANALVDNGRGGELLISRAFASRVGIDYVNSEWERVELQDKTLLPVARTKAVVTELVAFDVILGLPWLRRWNPVIDWRSEKMLVNVGAVHVKKDVRKGSDWFMVHIDAMKADVQTGLSAKNDKEKLNHEWRALVEKYDDAFPEEHPGMPPRRNVELRLS